MAILSKKAEETRNARESLEDEIYSLIFESNKQVENDKVAQKIILSGENGLGKTSLALALFTEGLKEDEKIIYVGIDNSGSEIISRFFKKEAQAGQILPFNPDATKITETGASVKDEERVLERVTSTAAAIKKAINNGIKVKGVVIDGISFLLEYAESKMRIEKNLSVDQGTQMNAWKIRSKFFREFTSAYMALDVPVVFISHEDFMPERVEPGKELSSVKKRVLDECGVRVILDRKQSPDDNHVTDYIAKIKKNRSDIFTVGKTVTFMSANNEKSIAETNYEELRQLIFP